MVPAGLAARRHVLLRGLCHPAWQRAAVMVQQHCSGEGVSELGGAGTHLLKPALGLGDAQLHRLLPLSPWVC